MKYLVVGPTIINDIIFADQSRKNQVLGGSIFCVAGIKLWCDDCLYLSNVGEDFDRFYGDWMRANGCSTAGLRYILPHTWYTTLTYGDQGLHSEVSIYGPEEEALLETLDTIDPAHIAAHCRGVTPAGSTWKPPRPIPLGPPGRGARQAESRRNSWEIPTSATMDPARAPKVLETIRKVDIYSLNLPEAMSLFQADGEEAAIRAILELGTPCFFRVGKRGSYDPGRKSHLRAQPDRGPHRGRHRLRQRLHRRRPLRLVRRFPAPGHRPPRQHLRSLQPAAVPALPGGHQAGAGGGDGALNAGITADSAK